MGFRLTPKQYPSTAPHDRTDRRRYDCSLRRGQKTRVLKIALRLEIGHFYIFFLKEIGVSEFVKKKMTVYESIF